MFYQRLAHKICTTSTSYQVTCALTSVHCTPCIHLGVKTGHAHCRVPQQHPRRGQLLTWPSSGVCLTSLCLWVGVVGREVEKGSGGHLHDLLPLDVFFFALQETMASIENHCSWCALPWGKCNGEVFFFRGGGLFESYCKHLTEVMVEGWAVM